MSGLTCICQPDGMTANCELPTSNWEGVIALMLCVLVVLAKRCWSDLDYESEEDDDPPSDMYR
jgi:hypothetical protein